MLFVVNPVSGGGKEHDVLYKLRGFADAQGWEAHYYETTGHADEAHVCALIADLRPHAVVAVGGDGTVGLVGNCIVGSPTLLGIVPLGSGNGLSKDLGIPQDFELALQRLCTGTPKAIDTITMNGRHCYHMADIGFNAEVVHRYGELAAHGALAYAQAALERYPAYTSPHVCIETDRGRFEGEAFLVALANSRQFGSNAVINPDGVVDDGHFEVCILTPFSATDALGIFTRLYVGDISGSAHLHVLRCTWAEVFPAAGTAFQMDGEPLGQPAQISAKIWPGSLQVIV